MYSFGRTVGCVAISYRIWVDNLLINLYYIILDGTRLTAFTWVLSELVESRRYQEYGPNGPSNLQVDHEYIIRLN